MIPDFPHNIRIRLAFFLLLPDVALSLPSWLSQFRDRTMYETTKMFLIRPILFLYYEESLVSSNLNSKLFRFHCVRPDVDSNQKTIKQFFWQYLFINYPVLKEKVLTSIEKEKITKEFQKAKDKCELAFKRTRDPGCWSGG